MTHQAPDGEEGAAPYLPSRGGLPTLRRAAADCRGCPLYKDATQTVFGSGTRSARLMLIGEQPGDQEDVRGLPFVGPAGKLLRKALGEAGLSEKDAYLTNAVKHFKFERQGSGRRRIHKTPDLHELKACRPWLAAELKAVDPELVVALGATAGKALLDSSFRVGEQRGLLLPAPDWDDLGHAAASSGAAPGHGLVCTVHPSAVLRADDRESAYEGLLADLGVAAEALASGGR
ncbi:UdgX family uracil-DNA binding protein [Streptomyces sp. NPDC059524]|uniref:UdgX family uracil-DNA binding protein n=1 Tax=Streptomyces sp. NPDC059524 TaxID=3346856 RepID=UPI0036AD7AC4